MENYVYSDYIPQKKVNMKRVKNLSILLSEELQSTEHVPIKS